MTDHIRTLQRDGRDAHLLLPQRRAAERGRAATCETPESLAAQLERFVAQRLAQHGRRLLRHHAAHIRAHRRRWWRARRRARVPEPPHRAYYSGIELVEAEESNRPLIVGERTNVIGSRLFKQHDRGGEVGRGHRDRPPAGAQRRAHRGRLPAIAPTATRLGDIPPFYEKLIRKIKAPVMIDTTDPRAVELALTYCQGKSIINSINLEDGEEKFERVCPIARAYGAALVVGTIDEDKLQAQAFTRERKLAVAERSLRAAHGEVRHSARGHHHRPAGVPLRHRRRELHRRRGRNHRGRAADQGERCRYVKTVLGISNISFGLPAGGARSGQLGLPLLRHQGGARPGHRERGEAGALRVHSRRRSGAWPSTCCSTRRPPKAPRSCARRPEDWREQTPRAEDRHQPVPHRGHHRALPQGRRARRKARPRTCRSTSGWRTTSSKARKDGLIDDLDRKRAEGAAPLDIINGPLMAGMAEVGPAVQQQRADRGRGAAIGRGDEGRRRATSSSSWRRPRRPRAARSCSPP